MKALSILPKLNDSQWDEINSNGVGTEKYSPLNWVVIDNVLIKAQYNNSVKEQKLWEYLVSLINISNPNRELKVKKIDMIHFIFPETRGKKSTEFNPCYYGQLKRYLKNLNNNGITIKFDNKKGEIGLAACSYMDHEDIEYIIVEFTERIFPFLCCLTSNFTKYRIGYIDKLNVKYSIPLYKYFTMNANIRESNKKILWIENLEDLRFLLNIKNKYKQFADLSRYLLRPSIEEINKNTDIEVEYEIIRGGVKNLKAAGIAFTAKKKYKETAIEKSKNKVQYKKINKPVIDDIVNNIYNIDKENSQAKELNKNNNINTVSSPSNTDLHCLPDNNSNTTEIEKKAVKKLSFFKILKKLIKEYKALKK